MGFGEHVGTIHVDYFDTVVIVVVNDVSGVEAVVVKWRRTRRRRWNDVDAYASTVKHIFRRIRRGAWRSKEIGGPVSFIRYFLGLYIFREKYLGTLQWDSNTDDWRRFGNQENITTTTAQQIIRSFPSLGHK